VSVFLIGCVVKSWFIFWIVLFLFLKPNSCFHDGDPDTHSDGLFFIVVVCVQDVEPVIEIDFSSVGHLLLRLEFLATLMRSLLLLLLRLILATFFK
jgi:hypothetical protein